jgi:hypothetical protein
MLIAPFLIIGSIITIIGIPVGLVVGIAYALASYGGKLIVYYSIGKRILHQFTPKQFHRIWSLLTGIVICSGLSAIPVIGGIFTIFVFLWGSGAVVFALASKPGKER